LSQLPIVLGGGNAGAQKISYPEYHKVRCAPL
jgi:hypothetical protein